MVSGIITYDNSLCPGDEIMILIESIKQLGKFFQEMSITDIIGFDIETDGLDFISNKILSIQISSPSEIFVFTNPEMFEYVISLIEDKLIIGHNLKFDLRFIYHNYHILPKRLHDTMLVNAILNAGRNGFSYISLNDLTERYLGISLDKTVRDKFSNASKLSDEMVEYAGNDVRYLHQIFSTQMEELEQENLIRVYDLEMKLLPVVVTMEVNGISLDTDKWLEISAEKQKTAIELESKLKETLIGKALTSLSYSNLAELLKKLNVPVTRKRDKEKLEKIFHSDPNFYHTLIEWVNLASPKQLLTLLNLYGINLDSTSSKAIDAYIIKNNLTEEQKELFDLLQEFRQNLKRASAFGSKYLEKYLKPDGKLHSEFHQLGTATGRFSSSNPNLQQVPHTQDYRSCFVASPGYKLITADYSQMELRIMAALSNETMMLDAYRNGEDLHKLTASLIFEKPIDEITKEERSVGKKINFATIYGAGAYRIAIELDIPKEEAAKILQKFQEGYQNMYQFINLARKKIIELGYSVTILGRKRYFEKPKIYTDYKEKNKIEQAIMREGVNHIIQGTGADIMKLAMVNMFYDNPFGKEKFRILLQVHDEVVVEVSEDIAEEAEKFIREKMLQAECNLLNNRVPCDLDSHIENYWVK